jgi:hypothetical protein
MIGGHSDFKLEYVLDSTMWDGADTELANALRWIDNIAFDQRAWYNMGHLDEDMRSLYKFTGNRTLAVIKRNVRESPPPTPSPTSPVPHVMHMAWPMAPAFELADETTRLVADLSASAAACDARAEAYLAAGIRQHETHVEALDGGFGDDAPDSADPIGGSVLQHGQLAQHHI